VRVTFGRRQVDRLGVRSALARMLCSRKHCVFEPAAGRVDRWIVRDADSLNGTYVNGNALDAGECHLLSHRDVVSLGNALFVGAAGEGTRTAFSLRVSARRGGRVLLRPVAAARKTS